MKLVLKENVDGLGARGQVVEVKPGYARNYLLPNKLAMPATPANIKFIEDTQKRVEITGIKAKDTALQALQQLERVSLTIMKPVGENQELFGSVTASEIAEKLKGEGFEIDKKKIIISEPIKKPGIYDIHIDLHPEVKSVVKVWVVKE